MLVLPAVGLCAIIGSTHARPRARLLPSARTRAGREGRGRPRCVHAGRGGQHGAFSDVCAALCGRLACRRACVARASAARRVMHATMHATLTCAVHVQAEVPVAHQAPGQVRARVRFFAARDGVFFLRLCQQSVSARAIPLAPRAPHARRPSRPLACTSPRLPTWAFCRACFRARALALALLRVREGFFLR